MGDRVSISFQRGGETSVVLFSHWQGMDFVKKAKAYARELKLERGDAEGKPLDRMEPHTVIVDFIRYVTKDMPRVESDLYLGANENEGDNSDNGHHIIKL